MISTRVYICGGKDVTVGKYLLQDDQPLYLETTTYIMSATMQISECILLGVKMFESCMLIFPLQCEEIDRPLKTQ